MEICINYGGKKHCFYLPIYQIPFHWGKPGPGPINYPALFQDAVILASVAEASKHLADTGVRKALVEGLTGSFRAAQQLAGKDVTINAPAGFGG
jgi:hypothetical protein